MPESATAMPSIPEQTRPVLRRASAWVWRLAVAWLLLFGAVLAWFFAQPYSAARAAADRLSKDGSMERLTPELFAALRGPGLVIGLLVLSLGVLLVLFGRRSQAVFSAFLTWLSSLVRRMPADLRSLTRAMAVPAAARLDLAAALVIAAGGALARVLSLWKPLTHDEAYTFVVFASRPWLALVSDYHLPNNHIFHSVLVKIATQLFGIQPWVVRLPAFACGVLTIPVVYLLANRLYGRSTALLSAGLAAALPVQVLYSTNARGYSPYTLFTLLLFCLAIYLKGHRNLVGWLCFIVIGALGFYTLPMMVYPFGGVMAWLLLSMIFEQPAADYGSRLRLFKYLMTAGLLVGLLSALLYLPVILWGTGWHSLVGNSFVERLSLKNLGYAFVSRMQDTREEWMMGLPGWLGLLLAAGFIISIALHRWISRVGVPVQLAMTAWIAAALLIQRPNPIARMWTFLIPLCAIWSAAGLVEFFKRVRLPGKAFQMTLGTLLALAGLVSLGSFAYQHTHASFPAWRASPGRVEQVVRFLQPRMEGGDMLVISSGDAPVLWYYSMLYGIPSRTYDRLERHLFPFKRAFIVVSQRDGQTLSSAIVERGLDPRTFDLALAAGLMELDGMQVFSCPVR